MSEVGPLGHVVDVAGQQGHGGGDPLRAANAGAKMAIRSTSASTTARAPSTSPLVDEHEQEVGDHDRQGEAGLGPFPPSVDVPQGSGPLVTGAAQQCVGGFNADKQRREVRVVSASDLRATCRRPGDTRQDGVDEAGDRFHEVLGVVDDEDERRRPERRNINRVEAADRVDNLIDWIPLGVVALAKRSEERRWYANVMVDRRQCQTTRAAGP